MSNSILQRILGSTSVDSFFRNHWEKAPLIEKGPLSRFSPLPNVRALSSISDLLQHYRSPVMILGDLAIRETEGLADRVAVLPVRARELYQEGATLEFDCLEMYVPEVREVVSQLAHDLELPQGTFGKAVGYLSAEGSGVSPHFDAYVNFVLQLRGKKKWSLLRNEYAKNPLEHYALNEFPFVPEELATYCNGDLPTDYFAHANAVELEPGDLLFVPRGVWHATEATEESFSVHMTFSVPTWLEVALASLRLVMAPVSELRALAVPRSSNREIAAAAITELCNNLQSSKLLEVRDEPYDKYQIAGAVFRQVLKLESSL